MLTGGLPFKCPAVLLSGTTGCSPALPSPWLREQTGHQPRQQEGRQTYGGAAFPGGIYRSSYLQTSVESFIDLLLRVFLQASNIFCCIYLFLGMWCPKNTGTSGAY